VSELVSVSRRRLLKFLIGAPFVSSAVSFAGCDGLSHASSSNAADAVAALTDPAAALGVMDFEEAARRVVAPGHWAYIQSGVDGGGTVRENAEAFNRLQLRPRRLRDLSAVSTEITLFGTQYSSPIFICPISGQRAIHPEGDIAVARAARSRRVAQCVSTAGSFSVEDVNAALGRPAWFQLYPARTWEANEALLGRVEAAGVTVLALTIDNIMGRNLEPFLRARPKDRGQCTQCHSGEPGTETRPMTGQLPAGTAAVALDWALLGRLRKRWRGTLLVKGIETREDARLCIEHGVDGVVVSNHGGRATETLRASVDALPEIVGEVGGRMPVLVDGGVRRGTDVFKALALGATAVGIGRPFLWGLGAFGTAGVERVLTLLHDELVLAMRSCGTASISEISGSYVSRR